MNGTASAAYARAGVAALEAERAHGHRSRQYRRALRRWRAAEVRALREAHRATLETRRVLERMAARG